MAPLNIKPGIAGKLSKSDIRLSVTPSGSLQQNLGVEVTPSEVGPEEEDEGLWVPEVLVEPPDGGWGWVIVAASFLSNMVVDGIAYTFGLFLMEFVHHYGSTKGKVAWVGSLLTGCYLSVGPLVSALTNKFGCRPVSMAGSIIACSAFILSTIAPSVDVLMITYGILGGIGLGLIYLPAIVSVGYYFSTKRALATGIAVCGSGVGAFIFAPICQLLLDVYDWKGALIILAGLNLNCMVFGALMRPLRATAQLSSQPATKPLLQRIAEEKERRQRQDSIFNSQYTIVQHDDGTLEKKPKDDINMEPGVHSTFFLDQFGKSPADTPIMTLSPIEEANKSPVGSKEEDMEDDIGNSTTTLNNHATSAPIPIPLNSLQNGRMPNQISPCSSSYSLPPHANSAPNPAPINRLSSTNVTPMPAIREIARRKGLVPATQPPGALKISQSNVTVNNEVRNDLRKNSLTMKLSSSGFLCPGQPNNNYLLEEVWKSMKDESMLDSSRRSSLRRLSMRRSSSKKDLARPLYRKDIFYSGSIVNLPEFKQSQKDVRSYVASVISIPREPAVIIDYGGAETRKSRCPCHCLPKSMRDTMKEMLDFSLLKDKVFLLICASNVIGMLGFNVPFMYIPDCASLQGVDKNSAAFLLSIIGITNTFGRIFVGWLADRPNISSLLLNNVSITICGFLVIAVPFCDTYLSIVIICVLFGIFVSTYICLTSIILVELLGLDKLTNAFGLLSLFRGVSCMIGPPLAGTMFDITGSYILPFVLSGVLLIISAIMLFFIPCLVRERNRLQVESGTFPGNFDAIPEEQEETNV